MTDKVWLVTSGSYSDYQVHCAFTSREVAIQYAAAMNKITPAEQTQLQGLSDLYYGARQTALNAMSEQLRTVDMNDGYLVEGRDLYTELPIVPKEEA